MVSQIVYPQVSEKTEWLKRRKWKCHFFRQKATKVGGKKDSYSFWWFHLQLYSL